jgi:CspA family cold shock protein
MGTQLQDEILYCARCGISFLWSQEEQKWAQGSAAPKYCPGCRRLLPVDGRERGQVKWYDPRKQYGFIVRAAQPDLYVHRSALRSGRALHPDELVEFNVEETERGPTATDVAVIRRDSQSGAAKS